MSSSERVQIKDMAAGNSNGNAMGMAQGTAQPLIPVFKGENYEFWSIRVKTILRSQDLWDFVETGLTEPEEGAELSTAAEAKFNEAKKKDAKALAIIQQAVHDTVFSRIATCSTSQQAWNVLKKEFQGDSKVMVVRLQLLRREFETLQMKNDENISEFLSKTTAVVSQMRTYGAKIDDQTIVEKVLRSLNSKFDHVVAAIEESKDLSIFSFDELMGSLQVHEVRINRGVEKEEEKAFQVQDNSFKRGRGRGNYRGGFRGRSPGRGRTYAHGKGRGDEQRSYMNSVQCYNCGNYGHMKADCWSKDEQSNFTKEEGDEGEHIDGEEKLFMAQNEKNEETHQSHVWFIDSGYSNHMTGCKSLFSFLDESDKQKVRLGNGCMLYVEGRGTVKLEISPGIFKFLHNVQYVPALGFNLISVGQLMQNGYLVLFDNGECCIREKKTGRKMISIMMTKNQMFPLDLSTVGHFVLTARAEEDSTLWHLSTQSKAYRLYNPESKKILTRRDVIFDESMSWNWREKDNQEHLQHVQQQVESIPTSEADSVMTEQTSPLSPQSTPSPISTPSTTTPADQSEGSSTDLSTPAAQRRYRSLADLYETCGFALMVADPVTFEEAQRQDKWRSDREPTLYAKRSGKGDFLMVCLYVDDMIFAGSSQVLVDEFKKHMKTEFDMTDLGSLKFFLGLEVTQGEDGIFLKQELYAKELLKKFGMINCSPVMTPLQTNEKLINLSVVSRFMENPSQTHFGAAKRILRYIAGTAEFGIWYSSKCSMTDNGKLYGYSDSDFGSCLDDRRSISAHVFSLGSGVVAWSSKKQPITALSSTEAEYVAVAFAACQAVWIRGILSELQEQSKAPTIIFCDNKSTIFMTKNAALHSRTKHIDTRMHFIRDLVTGKVVDIQYCSTHDQLADVLTKALPKDKFIRFRTLLGVCNYESRGSVESDSY
ncbi:hypothetical protein MRB53_035402 [Persea americana]|uniref:Uncharacterized protein n=1 Tax=Persea americana TaxID=3435 RepID=A0ACC2K4J6_PERAE|nr:hypothetical protein MRB53_035402 [Persea americana]